MDDNPETFGLKAFSDEKMEEERRKERHGTAEKRRHFKKFIEETTFHGVRFIVQEGSVVRR